MIDLDNPPKCPFCRREMDYHASTGSQHPDYVLPTGEAFMDPLDQGNHWVADGVLWECDCPESNGRLVLQEYACPGEPTVVDAGIPTGEHLYTVMELIRLGKWPKDQPYPLIVYRDGSE